MLFADAVESVKQAAVARFHHRNMRTFASAQSGEVEADRIARSEFDVHLNAMDVSPPQRDAMEAAYAGYASEYEAGRRMR